MTPEDFKKYACDWFKENLNECEGRHINIMKGGRCVWMYSNRPKEMEVDGRPGRRSPGYFDLALNVYVGGNVEAPLTYKIFAFDGKTGINKKMSKEWGDRIVLQSRKGLCFERYLEAEDVNEEHRVCVFYRKNLPWLGLNNDEMEKLMNILLQDFLVIEAACKGL